MTRYNYLKPNFVDNIPQDLNGGEIYISILYKVAIHNCCCGCGNKVATPFHGNGWKLTHNNDTISLHPSIGSFSLDCQSHYWIRNNKVIWI